MADETSRRYLFVAIDRATRWVFIRIFRSRTAANARRFLRDLERACPIRIRTSLTKRAIEGTIDEVDGSALTVERFNGRIEEVLQSHHFRSGEELETKLHRYV